MEPIAGSVVDRGNVGGEAAGGLPLSGARVRLILVGSVVRREVMVGAGAFAGGGMEETGLTGDATRGVELKGLSAAATKLKADLRGELGFDEDCA